MKKTGVVIVAAGMSSRMKQFKPLMPYKTGTLITTIIDTFQKFGLDPIVVVTGNQCDQLEYELHTRKVICVRNTSYETTEMFDSAKIGMIALKNKCDRFLFTPVDAPGFTTKTVQTLLINNDKIVKPSYKRKSGHPIMIDNELIETILSYHGKDGLRGALIETQVPVTFVNVSDEGIWMDLDTPEDYKYEEEKQNRYEYKVG